MSFSLAGSLGGCLTTEFSIHTGVIFFLPLPFFYLFLKFSSSDNSSPYMLLSATTYPCLSKILTLYRSFHMVGKQKLINFMFQAQRKLGGPRKSIPEPGLSHPVLIKFWLCAHLFQMLTMQVSHQSIRLALFFPSHSSKFTLNDASFPLNRLLNYFSMDCLLHLSCCHPP